jgi:hypothetical protein
LARAFALATIKAFFRKVVLAMVKTDLVPANPRGVANP